MDRILDQVVEQEGVQILLQPRGLREALTAAGMEEASAITLELALAACPSLGTALQQEELSGAECNALVSALAQSAALSPAAARKVVGDLAQAARVRTPHPAPYVPRPVWTRVRGYEGAEQWRAEEDVLRGAEEALTRSSQDGQNIQEALADLEQLSRDGSGIASYRLGEYFHRKAGELGEDRGESYFSLAAAQGYGPAYGALADYALNGKRRSIPKAARCYAHPSALAGPDGKNWLGAAEQLRAYRRENRARARAVLLLSLLFFVIAFFSMAIKPALGGLMFLMSLACIASSIAVLAAPWRSLLLPAGGLFLGWILAAAVLTA